MKGPFAGNMFPEDGHEIFDGIADCDTFLVFGTRDYGEDTGNPICSYKEISFAMKKRKTIALLRTDSEMDSNVVVEGSLSTSIHISWCPKNIGSVVNDLAIRC